MKRCFYIGHREPCDTILPTLIRIIEKHIVVYGVTEFIVGNHGGFDRTVLTSLNAPLANHPTIQYNHNRKKVHS